MKNIFRKIDKVGLSVLMLTFFVAVGFTAAERMETEAWYEVEIAPLGDPTKAEDQLIIGLYPGGAPLAPCNQTAKTSPVCAVSLSGNLPTTFPLTMEEAEDDNSIEIKRTRHSDEDN